MLETNVPPATVSNQLPPRTTTSHRWPRKWATLGGRGTSSMISPPTNLDDIECKGKVNGHHVNGNGHHHSHRQTISLFRKSSTISRTNGTTVQNSDITNQSQSLKKSRSLINVLRSKLNSPAVLRRFRTKSRENGKQTINEINNEHRIEQEKLVVENNDENKKHRKRDPSPMRRLTSRLAQLTRSSTHTSIENEQQTRKSPSPIKSQDKDQVDHINACYDEIRAKYFDNHNGKQNTIENLVQNPCAPTINDRLKDLLSTTTTSSIDYYDRPNSTNGDIYNRSLSTISMNGSLLSHDFLNNSHHNVQSSPPKTSDDPLLQARKQSNIKLNCMLSGYCFTTPFGNQEKALGGQHDLFKFHHYHDVGKRKYDFHFTNSNNRMYSSLRARPMSRSIDSFRHVTSTNPSVEDDNPLLLTDEISTNQIELCIRENDEHVETEKKMCSPKVHVTPAVSINVKTFVTTTTTSSSSKVDLIQENVLLNEKSSDDNEFERNFLRAVDRALGVANNDDNHLLQPVYDIPTKTDDESLNIINVTEENYITIENTKFFTEDERNIEQIDDGGHIDGNESPNVELFDRTGELFDNENVNWQSSAVYDHQPTNSNKIDDNVWSVVDDLTRKAQDLLYDEPQVSPVHN